MKQPTLPEIPPKPPRRMRAAPKDILRDQLALAADTIIAERLANAPPVDPSPPPPKQAARQKASLFGWWPYRSKA